MSEKLALVSAVESGRKKVDICREYGISASTLSSITKNKDSIVGAYEESRLEAKRLRKAAREDLDRALLCWYHQAVACGTPISGPLLQAKAEQIAAELGYEDCSVANAWVERFKRRHSLTYARERVKSSADSEVGDADAWLATAWPQIRSGYEPWDIFSAVETGLFFRALPKESAQLSDCRCEQGQLAHDRLTVYVCANMTGDEKRPLVVVGASPLSRNVTLPGLNYSVNDKAWMTRQVFLEELGRWERELDARKRKVLLLVDHTACHELVKRSSFRNIALVYAPPNTMGMLLPLDRGVVGALKRNYRKALLVQTVLQDIPTILPVREALRLLAVAWKDVKASAVRAAFAVCGLQNIYSVLGDDGAGDCGQQEDSGPLELWASRYNLPDDVVDGIGEFERMDEFVATCAKLQYDQGSDEGSNKSPSSRSDSCKEPAPKRDEVAAPFEVLDAVALLLKYCENQPPGVAKADAERTVDALISLRSQTQIIAFKKSFTAVSD